MSVNQAVLFTKPVHHLGIDLTPSALADLAQDFFEGKGFRIVLKKQVTGPELAARDVIRQHYLMYSKTACAEVLELSDAGRARFEEAFEKSWDEEVACGRILSTAHLLEGKKISVHQLFNRWNNLFAGRKTVKLQDGIIMGFLEDLDAYCVNAFYPSMEANFYSEQTAITYFVVEFDPVQVSWKEFRKTVLGSTNASNAVPESFRGQLYAEYPVEFPGRDNFAHGSAGPFEGFVERAIHEADFEMPSNPVGRYLAERGVTLESFAAWKAAQSITALGELFDATEEKNTDDVLPMLDQVDWTAVT